MEECKDLTRRKIQTCELKVRSTTITSDDNGTLVISRPLRTQSLDALSVQVRASNTITYPGGFTARQFNTLLYSGGSSIQWNGSTEFTVQPGSYRLSGFSILFGDTIIPSYEIAGYAALMKSDNTILAVASIAKPKYNTPSSFDEIVTFDEVCTFEVKHQAGPAPNPLLFLQRNSGSLYHVVASLRIERLV